MYLLVKWMEMTFQPWTKIFSQLQRDEWPLRKKKSSEFKKKNEIY